MDVPHIIESIVERLKTVEGITALVLGGSRANGTATAASDIDIGIYYDLEKKLDLAGIRRIATELDDESRENLVTEIGGWGPWINGGGWLKVDKTAVDFLFKDLNKVEMVIRQCLEGNVTIDYQPGHPHGFANSIYMAEIAACRILWDPTGKIGALKALTTPYSAVLKDAIIRKYFWEASFSLDNAAKGISKQDLAYVAGCCFRTVCCLNQVLFAVNETYLLNEKGAAAVAAAFPRAPVDYLQRVNDSFRLLTTDPEGNKQVLHSLRALIDETGELLK